MKFLNRLSLSLIFAASSAFAGTYGPQNFESFGVGTTTLGDGSTIVNATPGIAGVYAPTGGATPKALRLTATTTGSNYGGWKLPVLDASGEVTAFDISFKCQQYNTGNIADGFTINFGAVPGGTDPGAGESGFSMANGMFITFDTYNNAGDSPQIRVYANNLIVGAPYTSLTFPVGNTAFHSVVIHWDGDGLDMTYDGAQVFLNRQLPGFVPAIGNIFAFTARTGGVTQDTYIDDVQISTSTQPPLTTTDVVITEFLADNGDGIEDEDTETSDWIELYNGTGTAVSLNGWRLTNASGNNALWTFPNVSIPAYSYLRVFASGKNRTTPVLHTNFTLAKEGGYLALVKPDGTTKTSEFNYGQQSEDVSFGGYGPAQEQKYMSPPTPGGKNEVLATNYADGRPSEEVVFSREGGIFTGTVQLGVTASIDPTATIRYTTDGALPTAASPIFNPATPLNISTSTQIRARTFQPGRLPGDVSSRVFLLLDASLSSYGTTGQPFKSNLPIIVVESWGTNVDAVINPAGPRPHRPIYSVVINKDPLAGNLANITALPEFQGRGGMHVRGQTSASFGQKPYAWEIWTNEDEDKSVPLLGMPADGDWVLQTIYNDKTGMRNILPQTLMQETNGNGSGVRSRFVEVFFNQDGGPISYADYRGVYVLMEHIERGSDRIDISKLSPLATDPAVISGGYVFKKDKLPQAPMYNTTSTGIWGAQTHEITEPDTASAVQVSWLQGYVQAFDNALSGANFADPVVGYKAYIEPQTFMDNHQWVEVFKQIDGYRLSTYYTKDRGKKIRALPIWDYNLSGGNGNYGGPLNTTLADNPVGWYYDNCNAPEYPYYSKLFTDPDFKAKYWDRYWKLRRGVFSTAYIHAKIDGWANDLTNNQYATNVTNGVSVATGAGDFYPTNKGNDLPPSQETPARLESPISRHFDRWPILGVYVWPNPANYQNRTTFQSEVQWMKDWFTNRLAWIDSQSAGGKAPNFSSYGGNVPSGTSLTMTNPNASGSIYFTTDGSDPNTPNLLTMVPENSPCVWLVPTVANGGTTLTAGAGANQWTSFAEPPNLANWSATNAAVGYDANGGTDFTPFIAAGGNTQSQMAGITRTCYMRIAFNIPDAGTLASIGSLLLQSRYDDGYRVFINGVAVGGKNTHSSMTQNPANAQASLPHADNLAVTFESEDITTLGRPQLVVGPNVLAIHAAAFELTGDFLFAPRLMYTSSGSTYSTPITLVNSTTVKARVFANGVWGPLTEASFVVGANPAASSNIVISEICYNPPASGVYTSKDLEFITLKNISAGNVDLTGVRFDNGITYSFAGTPQQLTLAPGGEVILAANPTALAAVHGAAPPGTQVFGPYEGALDNTGESLTLRTVSGDVIKDFAYSTLPPWPMGASIVLEHPSTNPDHGSGYNWRLGTGARGTPYSNDSVGFTGTWDADTDGDGLADGLEYSLGSDAADPTSAPQLAVTTGTETVGMTTGNFLRVVFRRSLANDAGTTVPELSTDLALPWQSGMGAFARIAVTNNLDGTCTETWRTLTPVNSPQAFARIKTTSP